MIKTGPRAKNHDFTLSSLHLYWCSDCRADQLFETPPPHSDGASELACTNCGAAYFDAIDVVVDEARLTRVTA